MHAKEANVHAVNLLKHKHGLGPIGELGGEIPCKPIPHEGACVQRLVGGGDHSDGDITRSRVLVNEDGIDSLLEVRAQLRNREAYGQQRREGKTLILCHIYIHDNMYVLYCYCTLIHLPNLKGLQGCNKLLTRQLHVRIFACSGKIQRANKLNSKSYLKDHCSL